MIEAIPGARHMHCPCNFKFTIYTPVGIISKAALWRHWRQSWIYGDPSTKNMPFGNPYRGRTLPRAFRCAVHYLRLCPARTLPRRQKAIATFPTTYLQMKTQSIHRTKARVTHPALLRLEGLRGRPMARAVIFNVGFGHILDAKSVKTNTPSILRYLFSKTTNRVL